MAVYENSGNSHASLLSRGIKKPVNYDRHHCILFAYYLHTTGIMHLHTTENFDDFISSFSYNISIHNFCRKSSILAIFFQNIGIIVAIFSDNSYAYAVNSDNSQAENFDNFHTQKPCQLSHMFCLAVFLSHPIHFELSTEFSTFPHKKVDFCKYSTFCRKLSTFPHFAPLYSFFVVFVLVLACLFLCMLFKAVLLPFACVLLCILISCKAFAFRSFLPYLKAYF